MTHHSQYFRNAFINSNTIFMNNIVLDHLNNKIYQMNQSQGSELGASKNKDEARREAIIDKMDKDTHEILTDIQKQMEPISFSYLNSFIGGSLDELKIPKSYADEHERAKFPDQLKGQVVQRIEIRAVENFEDAIEQFNGLRDTVRASEKKNSLNKQISYQKIEKYEKQNYKILRAYLSNKKLIIQTGGKSSQIKQGIKISEYEHILIQERSDYERMQRLVEKHITDIEEAIRKQETTRLERFVSMFKGSQRKIDIEKVGKGRIEQIKNRSFFLTQKWAETGQQFMFRIICVYRKSKVQFSNFYIYHNDFFDEIDKTPLDNIKRAAALKDKLVLAHFTEKHQRLVKDIGQNYKQKTKNKFFNKTVLNTLSNEYVKEPEEEQISLQHADTIFQDYQKESMKEFISSWKNSSRREYQNSQTYLIVEPHFLNLPKSLSAKRVHLKIEQLGEQTFKFEQQNQNSLVFGVEEVKNFAVNLSKKRNKTLNFIAKVESDSGDQIVLKNHVKIQKIQNEALGFAYQIGLVPHNASTVKNFRGDYPYVLVFEAVVRMCSPRQLDFNVRNFREVNLLTKMGKIPNLYSTYFAFDYNPNIFHQMSDIFVGSLNPLDKSSFEKTYLHYAHFFQHEENSSQNFCLYMSNRNYRNDLSGYKMEDRYKMYAKELTKETERIKEDFSKFFGQDGSVMISKITKNKHLANMKDDLKKYESYNKTKIQMILERYVLYTDFLKKNQRDGEKVLGYNACLIKIADLIVEIYDRNFGDIADSQIHHANINDLFLFFTAFVLKIYPYHRELSILQNDLYHMRVLAQRYLPQVNRQLNRRGIGLENYASDYLLNLFTNLPMELCYRIWDFFIKHPNKLQHSRIITMYTILIFQQKSDFLPVFPINTFIQATHVNFNKIKLDPPQVYHFSKIVHQYTQKRIERRKKVQALSREKYLRRFIYGRNIKEVQILDEDQYDKKQDQKKSGVSFASSKVSPQKLQTKLLSINELSYPLPKPNYQGYKITKVCLFISGLFVLKKINLHHRSYKLQINLSKGSEIVDVMITDKNLFINKYFQFDSPNQNPEQIEFRILEEGEEIMNKCVSLENYHKDIAYRQSFSFEDFVPEGRSQEKFNLGTSVLNFSLVLRSDKGKKIEEELLEEIDKRGDEIFQKLLDYDVSTGNNEIVKEMKGLDKTFKKLMDPLDEMDTEKYCSLRLSTSFRQLQPEWITNSKMTVEQLKAIFNYIFTDEQQKQFCLNYANFYEDYAEGFQKFDLGKLLLEMILMAPMSKLKKMSLIYCMCVHYQNVSHKQGPQKMTLQTLNSVIREIMMNHSFLNSCPFSDYGFGKIISGNFYLKGDKVEEKKKDITSVLQDWAYLCQIKSKYGGMILGTADELSVLRAMLPVKFLKKMEEETHCRFEIVYRKGGFVYVWSTTVRTKDFSVAKRGVKFLNSYPKYNDCDERMSSIAEILLNCENIIPLQSSESISYEQFCKIFRQNPLLSYLLNIDLESVRPYDQVGRQDKFEAKIVQSRMQMSAFSEWNEDQRKKGPEFFTDFALFRFQNCLSEWKRCKVIKDEGKTLVEVQFENLKGYYQIPRYEVICMDQNLSQPVEPSQSSMPSASYTERNN